MEAEGHGGLKAKHLEFWIMQSVLECWKQEVLWCGLVFLFTQEYKWVLTDLLG